LQLLFSPLARDAVRTLAGSQADAIRWRWRPRRPTPAVHAVSAKLTTAVASASTPLRFC